MNISLYVTPNLRNSGLCKSRSDVFTSHVLLCLMCILKIVTDSNIFLFTENNDMVAVLIPPCNHLLLSFVPVEEFIQMKIVTDNISVLLHVQNLLTDFFTVDEQ